MRCVGPDEQPPSQADGWRQDDDVLDTWFSAGLWPLSTLGWPQHTAELRHYYPTAVLVTGYDIQFFWVARMMMFGLYAMEGQPPFEHVVLHGLIRDQHGKKMSKSRGNTIDPLALIDRYGADALRLTIARGANPGADMALSEQWVAGSRNFGTKLWNATRFALAHGADPNGEIDPVLLTDADRWIIDRIGAVSAEVDALLEGFQFAKATKLLYHFTWDELCDWYLELAKVQLGESPPQAANTRAVLGTVLDVLLRLLHPVMPFITESLWTALTGQQSLVVASWPRLNPHAEGLDPAVTERVTATQKLVTEVRRFRADQGLRDGQWVPARLVGIVQAGLGAQLTAVRALARLGTEQDGFTATATLEISLPGGSVRVELDTSGSIDVAAERTRLGKDLAAAHKELSDAQAKLANPKFTERAPANIVSGIHARRHTAHTDIQRIQAALDALPKA